MPKHTEFQKIYDRFVKRYGEEKGKTLYSTWLAKNKYNDTASIKSQKKESKEHNSLVIGLEIKESALEYVVSGLIATTHVDQYDLDPSTNGIPDKVPKETLFSFKEQAIKDQKARVCGVHHSEGKENGEFFGVGNPTSFEVKQLSDGEWGLYSETPLLKNDPMTPSIISEIKSGELNSFSITYSTHGDQTVDYDVIDDKVTRLLLPETTLAGYTLASNPVNPAAMMTSHGFKEFKELMIMDNGAQALESKELQMDQIELDKKTSALELKEAEFQKKQTALEVKEREQKEAADKATFEKEKKEAVETAVKETKEKLLESKEFKEKLDSLVAEKVGNNTEAKETKETKEFKEILEMKSVEGQFARVGRLAVEAGIITSATEFKATSQPKSGGSEFKSFYTAGQNLEFKGLGIGDNSTAYTMSQAEMQDVFDPVIYNALNDKTTFWGLLTKVNKAGSGSNNVEFVMRTGRNTSAGAYLGNGLGSGRSVRNKNKTAFKKYKVDVQVDGDMIAGSQGGIVGDAFSQEVSDGSLDLMKSINEDLFAEVGLEAAAGVIGLPYITDSAGNTSLYGQTRSDDNKLAPGTATDTYIQGSGGYSISLARQAKRYIKNEGGKKGDLIFVTTPTIYDLILEDQDDKRRHADPRMSRFGFETQIFIDGVAVFEDVDCKSGSIFCVDMSAHKAAIWVPPTLEMLGKRSDSTEGFVKTYFATFNTAPRRMTEIYGVTAIAS